MPDSNLLDCVNFNVIWMANRIIFESEHNELKLKTMASQHKITPDGTQTKLKSQGKKLSYVKHVRLRT